VKNLSEETGVRVVGGFWKSARNLHLRVWGEMREGHSEEGFAGDEVIVLKI